MDLYAVCRTCTPELRNLEKPKDAIGLKVTYAWGDVNNDFIALCECPKGHKEIVILNGYRFDILYFSAMKSYLDGNLSESVASFSSSLERAYELFIKTSLVNSGISIDNIRNFWKELSNQSERQYGAFCCKYLELTQDIWRDDTNKKKFRNKVIHKGHLATTLEVEEYAVYITSRLNLITSYLKDNLNDALLFFKKHEDLIQIEEVRKIGEKNSILDYSIANHNSLLFFYDFYKNSTNVDFYRAKEIMISDPSIINSPKRKR